MPLYDYKCHFCGSEVESIQKSDVSEILCDSPIHVAENELVLMERQLSAPGGIKVNGRMVLSQSQMRMIKEPVWQYPDGSVESAN